MSSAYDTDTSVDSALPSSLSASETASPSKSPPKPSAHLPFSGLPGPESVIEYRWPISDGEDYILQEPLANYLGITSFRRKFPDVFRRSADVEERRYLLHMKIINANEEIFGVTALKADDAHQLMQTHFPELHAKYVSFWKQKKAEEKAALLAKTDVVSMKSDHEKMKKLLNEAILDTARWNSQLNSDRKTDRSAYFDLQTFNVHYPRPRPTYNKDLSDRIVSEKAKMRAPFKVYSPEELKYFPFKTVSEGPLGVLDRGDTSDPVFPDSSDSETETETEPAPVVKPKSSSKPRRSYSKRQTQKDSSMDENSCSSPKRKSSVASTSFKEEVSSMSLDSITSSICGICFKGSQENKFGQFESLISCSQCSNAGHPTCLDLTESIVSVILTYNWQCMECKVCMTCKSATDEENLMFCDNCDRGYHSYCVGMSEIPSGRWVCEICGDCVSCLRFAKDYTAEWKEEFTRPRDKSEVRKFLQKHCEECSRKFNKGEFCPVCLKVFDPLKDVADETLTSCMSCERLVHLECDPKFAFQVRGEKIMSPGGGRSSLASRRKNPYNCNVCRLEVEERMDSFHVRNRHDKR